jgi:ribosomal protein S18 acetylase RimI-like enzyme
MPVLNFLPLHHPHCPSLDDLMQGEEHAWMAELSWNFSPIRQVLRSHLAQKMLPGYAAVAGHHALGYTYFLVHSRKGIVGTVYVPPGDQQQSLADELVALAVDSLKGSEGMRRIEAQIMTFHGVNLTAAFTRHGFQYHPRYYMQLDLATYPCGAAEAAGHRKVVPWDSAHIKDLAEMTYASYRDQVDAVMCEDYCSPEGCEGYIQSLVENPGCGTFLSDASFIALDARNQRGGFIIGSRISEGAGMIPQIAISPACQGVGLGKALMEHALRQFKSRGFGTVSLTVTKRNRRAFEWYQRLGFEIRKEFGAYVWTSDRT